MILHGSEEQCTAPSQTVGVGDDGWEIRRGLGNRQGHVHGRRGADWNCLCTEVNTRPGEKLRSLAHY
jgi:hypothetical protein